MVIDVGAGCGVIGLMLLHVGVAKRALAIELQHGLAQLAIQNALQNGLDRRHDTLRADLRSTPLREHSADLVVSNPPYRPLSVGQLPSEPERAAARHEIFCTPQALAREAARCLSHDGRLAVIYPTDRLQELRSAIVDAGMTLRRQRYVKSDRASAASHVLIEARHGETDEPVYEEEPLINRLDDGARSDEMKRILAGVWM